MLNISPPFFPSRIDTTTSVRSEVRSHPAASERSSPQAIQDFLGEVMNALLEPISSGFAEDILGEDEEDEEQNNSNTSLLKELGRACWGQTLLQSGQFKSMTQAMEDGLKRLDVSQQQSAAECQRVIHGA